MKLLDLVRRDHQADFARVLALSALAGLFEGGVLSLVAWGPIAVADAKAAGLIGFGVLSLMVLAAWALTRRAALLAGEALVGKVMTGLRVRVAEQLATAEVRDFESVPVERVVSALTTGVRTVAESSRAAVRAGGAAVMSVLGLLIVLSLSVPAFIVVAAMTALGLASYTRGTRRLAQPLGEAITSEIELLGGLDQLTAGFPLLKLNKPAADALLDARIRAVAQRSAALLSQLEETFAENISVVLGLLLLAFGAVVFVLPHLIELDPARLLAITTAVVYLQSQTDRFIQAVPVIGKAEAAATSLLALEADLAGLRREPDGVGSPMSLGNEGLALVGARFSYTLPSGEPTFSLGPIDAAFPPGQITFIVGGNGAGKTTLIKLITGIYAASDGKLRVGGARVEPWRRGPARALIGALFHDYHLFDRLYGVKNPDPVAFAEALEELGLGGLTGLDGARVTNTRLSSGQRRRLALAMALQHDRRVWVFDELAADQDPAFRFWVYTTLFPRLRAEGRAVIAVTHDDEYFYAADRVWMQESGQLHRLDAAPAGGSGV